METRGGRRPRLLPLPPPLPLLRPLLLMLLCVAAAWAYPAYLLDPEGCVEKKLEVGFEMMGKAAVADRRKRSPIKVCKGCWGRGAGGGLGVLGEGGGLIGRIDLTVAPSNQPTNRLFTKSIIHPYI